MLPQGNSQKSKKAAQSPRGRTRTSPVVRLPRDGAEGNLFSPLADATEGKTDEEVDYSDALAGPPVPIGQGGALNPTMAAMQQANPGGVFIPLTHPNYSSFLRRHLSAPSPSVRLPSDSFTRFLPSDGQRLSREASGLQTYIYSGQPPSDASLTKHQSDTLAQLTAIHGFDVTLFANLVIPDDALTSPVVIAVRDLFNGQIRPRIQYLTGNFQSTIIASPDLAVATAGDHTDVGYLLTDPTFDPKADPMVNARHYGKVNLPVTNMVKPGFGPFFRRPQGYNPDAYALVYSFNEAQFDPQIQYFRRDALYQLRELGALNRVLFLFFRGLAARITELRLSWASTFESQLDALEKESATGTLVDLSILPTFAYFAMKKINADCFLGALAWKAFLSNFSQSALSVHHKSIGNLYKFHLSGSMSVLTAFNTFETLYEQVKESAIHPDSVVLPHPALDEKLIVPVFAAAMVDLAKRAASQSAGYAFGVFKSATEKAVALRSFEELRKLLSAKSFAELGPILPSGMVAATISDSNSDVSHQRSFTPQLPDPPAADVADQLAPSAATAAAVKSQKHQEDRFSKSTDAQPPAAQPRPLEVMFKVIPEYVIYIGGQFFARCDSAGDKVKIPRKFYSDLPADTKLAFSLLKPFSYIALDNGPAHPVPAASHHGKKPQTPQKQPKPQDKPAKAVPVLAATSVGLSSQNTSSVPESSPPPGPMMCYDPRFAAHYDLQHHMYVPYGPQIVPYGAPTAPPVHFMPPDSSRPVAYGAPPDPYASHRAPVQFQNHSQAFFASPMQHHLSQHSVPVRTNFFDGSGGGYSRAPNSGYHDASGGGYQGSSPPPSQQSSHSGKLSIGDGRVGRDPWC